ncbi:MAG: hypothetical protein IT326_03920 [Anaerolineae bacterium]|nr:hypothetical protein [Anaerolineae bacterium]
MAPTELESLVGHLFIVSGRSIKAAPPGSAAMPSPRRAARGRDSDTFFGLVTLPDDQRQPGPFYEQLIQQVHDSYFQTSGGVTSALREAYARLNTHLLLQNRGQEFPLRVGLACVVLRESDLYIAVSGAARCFMVSGDQVERMPDNDEVAEGVLPLGLYDDFEIRLYHRQASPGDFLILSDASLNRLTDTTLRHVVSVGGVEGALNNLASVAAEYTSAEVIKFVSDASETAHSHSPAEPLHRRLPLFSGTGEPRPPAGRAGQSPRHTHEPEAAPIPASMEPDDTTPSPEDDSGQPSRLARTGHRTLLTLAGITTGARTLVEKMFPAEIAASPDEEAEPPFQLSVTMQIGVVVAVAILVALVVTGVYRFRGQTSQYAQLVREARSEIETARAAGSNEGAARPHWETAVFLLNEAAKLRQPGPLEQSLLSEAHSTLDAYDRVTRATTTLLRSYEPGADLQGPIVQGLNVYVIDTTADILYREDLDESGTKLLNREPRIITRQGELVSDQVVGGLIDLTWMDEGGVPQRNVLAAITRNGLLLTYSPSWDVSATVLPGFEVWQDPRAIAVYNRDLYILDAGANQIWYYRASSDSYPGMPLLYFTDANPELSDAIDMEIDTNGNVYVLHASGRTSKYFVGKQELFGYEDLPQPVVRPSAMHLSLSPFDRSLFIADPGGSRLYSLSPTGAFLYNFKGEQDEAFSAISGVYAMDSPSYIYLTVGSDLLYFPRP